MYILLLYVSKQLRYLQYRTSAMKVQILLLLLAGIVCINRVHATAAAASTAAPTTIEERLKKQEVSLQNQEERFKKQEEQLKKQGELLKNQEELCKKQEELLQKQKGVLDGLARQVMLQQFYTNEKTRGDGNSGLRPTRLTSDGTKNYYETAHVDVGYMAMHDHPNYDRTIGLGELNVVMNGIEFRTRHNDYKLSMPSRKYKRYNMLQGIPTPAVPPSVLKKATVQEQVDEMREYFVAFHNQNVKHRDYRPYFKANLCYLEGGWTKATKDIEEPFQSDRHSIDADTWFDLMEKTQFTSYTGSKSVLENFAYLPTSIYRVEKGKPLYAQWNYRIACHPISKNLPTSVFEPLDDLLYRLPKRVKVDQMKSSRARRFVMNERGSDYATKGNSLLDRLMHEIPGKDNYPANLSDNSFDLKLSDLRFKRLNTGYYHRYYSMKRLDANGAKTVHRGFNDANLWVAQTTNPNIIDMDASKCHKKASCKKWKARYTYALPLEVVYMTPLLRWNPYDMAVNVEHKYITDNGKRNGNSPATAFNGTHNIKYFYRTPAELFSMPKHPRVYLADTAEKAASVLDKKGQVRKVFSSGTRTFTPPMGNVGQIRLRYPIMPLHGEGSSVWKELNALKDMTMNMNRYAYLFEDPPTQLVQNATDLDGDDRLVRFTMLTTHRDPPGEHTHEFTITQRDYNEQLMTGQHMFVTTSESLGHSHVLEVAGRINIVWIDKCDGQKRCWDGHGVLFEGVQFP